MKIIVQENDLTLAKKENYLTQIEEQIIAKRKMLLENHNKLKKKKEENNFLTGVKEDYNKYFTYIKGEKEKQIQTMGILNDYLNEIIKKGKLTDEDMAETKREQNEILNSIDNIKSELDKIILD